MAKQSRTVFRSKKPKLAIYFALGWTLAALALVYFVPGPFDIIDWKLFDRKMAGQASPQLVTGIVHLDVDDRAIGRYGQWPWDREMSGKLVEKLHRMGARLVVFDIFYSSPGKSDKGNQIFFSAIKDAGNVISATGLPITDDPRREFEPRGDQPRIDALHDRAWPLQIPSAFRLFRVKHLEDTIMPLIEIIRDSRAVGHIKSTPDRDGVHRRIPLLVRFEDKCIPSLSLAALAAYWNVPPEDMHVLPGAIQVKHAQQVLRIPVDAKAQMIIRWEDPWYALKSYSVIDVLEDERDPSESFYKGKIVVVGVTAVGTYDRGPTPVDRDYPLSRIHSHALNTMLSGRFVSPVDFFPFPALIIAVATIVFSFFGARLQLRIGILISLAILALLVVMPFLAFSYLSRELPTAGLLFVFLPAATAILIERGTGLERDAARASRALERYLSPELLESIVERGTGIDLTTKRMELSVLVVDIEGFSTISEMVEVHYINQFLDEFFERVTNAVFEQHGTVDKFLGDGMLAFFGDPVPVENHARAAIRAALQMQREMVPLNLKWVASGLAAFEQGVRIRIGLNTGMVVVGNIGSAQRMEYTVLGSAVNIASRLQSLAPPGGVLMTARTKSLAKEPIEYEGPQTIRVKGIDKDIEVYKITKIPPRLDEETPRPPA
ncbi:MAG: adenylate/guanylate cyclase domain-containing protein [Thermodesulfobacteriota bacterium]